MGKQTWSITEITELFEVDGTFIAELEREEIVCPTCERDSRAKLFTSADLEKLRLAKVLMEDLGVNLAGVEVVLTMRQNMIDMRKQFDAILKDLSSHIRNTLHNKS